MRSVAEVIDLIERAMEHRRPHEPDSLAGMRYRALERVRDHLRAHGWPEREEDRFGLSLVPLVFQEANYDDIEWTDQAAPLGKLESFFEIDVLVQTMGRTRAELSEDEFSEYIQRMYAAIDSRRR